MRWRRWIGVVLMGLAGVAWASEPLRHVVQAGDTLYDLAERYLDDADQWQALAGVNGSPHPLRLPPGSIVVVPADWLRNRPGAATVEHLSGDVQVQLAGEPARALTREDRLIDGDVLLTARNGFATLRLADGALVRIAGDSTLTLHRVGYTVQRQRATTRVELLQGRVESTVPPRAGSRKHRFQVDTPLMSTGVRGTRFGVSAVAGRVSTDVGVGRVQAEVAGEPLLMVTAGQGASSAAPRTTVPLLPAPDLSRLPGLQTRPAIDVAFTPVPGAVAYRAYLARDASLDQVFDNDVFASPRVRLQGWVDGHYVMAVRAIDAQGIEGDAAIHAFELHARPEPPATLAPLPQAEVLAGDVAFAWTDAEGIAAYDIELRDGTPAQALVTAQRVTGVTVALALPEPGPYVWRIRAVPADGSRAGPYSEPRALTVRRPVGTEVAVAAGDDGVTLSWDGEPGQRFQAQIAADDRFATPVVDVMLDTPRLAGLDLPGGDWFFRVQATDTDGFVRSYSRPQRFFVPRLVRHGGGLLLTSDGARVDSP